MSFERDYESSLKDKRWRKAIKGIKDGGVAEEVGREIERALAGDCRDSKMRGLADAITAIEPVLREGEAIALNRLFVTQEDTSAMLKMLSATYINSIECDNHHLVSKLLDKVSEHIELLARDPSHIFGTAQTILPLILRSTLKDYIETKVCPALRIACRKRRITVSTARKEIDNAINHAKLDRIVARILARSEDNLHTSPRTSMTKQDAVNFSLKEFVR